MNPGIAKRRSFLNGHKVNGQRITIGFAGIADFRSFIGQEYIAGMMKAATDYDINFINMAGAIKYSLFDDIDFISHYLKNFRFMKAPLIDGLVTWGSSLCSFLDDKTVVDTINALKPLPIVDIGYLDIPGIPSIRIDNAISMALIINHLVREHHYSRFAYIGCMNSKPHETRLDALKKELEKNKLPFISDAVIMTKSMDNLDIVAATEKLSALYDLHGRKYIDAIITPSDIIAEEIIEQLDKRGISVPGDISITGFNNQYNGITARSPVTTVNLEYFKRGYAAVELLIDRIIAPDTKNETRLVPTQLVIRQSCGCFEKNVIDAGSHEVPTAQVIPETAASESEFRTYLYVSINGIFTWLSEHEKKEFVDAIFYDIYEQRTPSAMLRWFQTTLQNNRKSRPDYHCQQAISSLRRTILPMVKDDEQQLLHMEDIFHQLRVLISVFTEYDNIAQGESSYLFNNMSHIAISFASAVSGKQIEDVLRYQLSEMEIPGIVLALSDNMTQDLSSAAIEMILPEPDSDIRAKLPYRIYDPTCIPKLFFPAGRRYSIILEILYHADRYFGYAFLEMGSQNVAMYDAVRLLLSNALFAVYTREGRTKEHTMLLSSEQLAGILHLQDKRVHEPRNGLSVRQITNYLVEHLNEMTDLDKMARELMVSKSHLVRQAKELTGYTIQTLHETLKIEQAKNLLQVESLKLHEIAARLGFQNQNYFSTVFKKNTGMSPRAWAKRNR
jgi:DNA-binding LacI/PurR family transcriptional regulator/AraC-like DNA-binding protein